MTHAEPAPGLRFFTLAERLAELRAGGGIRGQAKPSTHGEGPTPVIENVGLRLRSPADSPASLLGAAVLPVPGGDLTAKWQGMMTRWQRDSAIIADCAAGPCRHRGAQKWLAIRDTAARLGGLERIDHVHRAINRSIAYATDFQINGAADHWASPLDSIERAGDCEDYVIAKYLMLRSLGMEPDTLKLVALFETVSGQFHAVLAAQVEGEWVYLDNKQGRLTRESDYIATRPLAVVNENGQGMLIAMPKPGAGLRLTTL